MYTQAMKTTKQRNDQERRDRIKLAGGLQLHLYVSKQAADALRRLMAKHGTKTAAIEAALIRMDWEDGK